jgi:hypothetical protein
LFFYFKVSPVEVDTGVDFVVVVEYAVMVEVSIVAEHAIMVELVVVELGAVVATLVRPGQIPLLERCAWGYSTHGSPLARVTVRPPPESVVYAVQLITSISAWFAWKPVADEERDTLADDEAPRLVNTPTICDPEVPLRMAMVWLSE